MRSVGRAWGKFRWGGAPAGGVAGRGEQPHAGEPSPPGAPALAAVQRYFEVSLFSLLATGVATLVTTGKLDPVATVVPPLALIYKAWRYKRGRGPELSHRTATWLTVAYFAFFPFDLFFFCFALAEGAPNRPLYAGLLAAIHLMLFALIVRLFSARTTRDYLFLTMLGFAMMLVAAILTVDTLYLGFFLLFLVLAVSTFVGLEMRRAAEGAVAPPLAAGTPAAKRLQKALGATSTSVALGSLALGTLIFLIIPRVTAGYLSGLNLQPSLISGFSDNVELGQIGTIKKSTAVTMRVRVEGGPAAARGVKWRGIALTTFNGRRWYTEEHEAHPVNPSNQGWYYLGYSEPKAPEITDQQLRQLRDAIRQNQRKWARPRELRYTILLEPMATDTLFFAGPHSAARGRFAPEVLRAGRRQLTAAYLLVDFTNSVSNPHHNYTRILYEAQTYFPEVTADDLRNHLIGYTEVVRTRYLQLPPLDPRIPDLAKRLTANAPTTYDKAVAIEQHLRTRYGYTLDLSGTPPADPLAHFLFERRAGHCEYFAAAMTVMLRTEGIAARYVNGFLPGEYNDVGEDFIVRASDAHSWVEVFFGEYGWIPFDPTPPSDEPPRGWLGRLMHYYDWFELAWSEWVINYDLARQVNLAQNFQRASREWSFKAQRYVRDKRRSAVDWLKRAQFTLSASPYSRPAGIALAVLLALLLRGRRLRQFLVSQWGLRFAHDVLTAREATIHYQQMLRLLARRGFPKRPGQTPLEFAASLPALELAGPVGRLTDLYQSARFGGRATEATRMSDLLDSLKAVLRTAKK